MAVNGREICSRWFEDLRRDESFETHGRTVTELDVVAFGALTGDTNPQHLDRHQARNGPFGGRIAHGALILSFALALVPIDPDRLVALRGLSGVKFKRPVRIGDTIHVVARVASHEPVDSETGRVTLAAEVRNQDDRLTARADIEVLWRRAPAAATARSGATRTRDPHMARDDWFELPGVPL